MKSCVYEGTVRHRRDAPARHSFHYSIFMMYLDLAELPDLFHERWFWSPATPNPVSYTHLDVYKRQRS